MHTSGLKGVQQSLCCLVGYAIFYYLTREASATNWQLTSGLRFAAFLFLPYRLWPAIFLGDVAGALAYRWNVVFIYGLPWFLVSFIGTPAAAAIPAALLRILHFQTWKLELSRKVIGLLQAAGLASLLNSVVGIAAMNVIHYAGDVKRMDGLPVWFLSVFLLGNFLGMLMVLPAVMTVRLLRTHRSTIAAHEARKLSVGFWRESDDVSFLYANHHRPSHDWAGGGAHIQARMERRCSGIHPGQHRSAVDGQARFSHRSVSSPGPYGPGVHCAPVIRCTHDRR